MILDRGVQTAIGRAVTRMGQWEQWIFHQPWQRRPCL